MNRLEIQDRVTRGVEWLDERHPGWAHEVNAETLSMTDGDYCILGQLYRESASSWSSGYVYASEYLITSYEDRVSLGFSGPSAELFVAQEYWVKAIVERKMREVLA